MQIHYRHPDEGLHRVLNGLKKDAIRTESRNGPVLRFPEPVILVNEAPLNRVSRDAVRDANPFFHFMESLWMLGGMNEVAPMAFYNSGIGQYSDDGDTLRGTAYGYKWRKHFGYDQLELAIERLKANPDDRRVVMTMWDPTGEWRNPDSKDLSCNLQVIVGARRQVDGLLDRYVVDMEVTNRSNDIVYGCLGSNVFHFSMLLEYIAYRTGYGIGRYYQMAFNLHGYSENEAFKRCYDYMTANNRYQPPGEVTTSYMKYIGFDATADQIAHFVRTGEHSDDPYLKSVGVPIYEAFRIWKLKAKGITVDAQKRASIAVDILDQCGDRALAEACKEWIYRRLEKLPVKPSL
jgi:thymidylate synthase